MGNYYKELEERLIASGIPFDEAGWVHLFETEEEFNEAYEDEYHEPWVGLTEEISATSYNKRGIIPPDPRLKQHLTFNIISAGTIVWKASGSTIAKTIEYSTDNGSTWTSITSTQAGV